MTGNAINDYNVFHPYILVIVEKIGLQVGINCVRNDSCREKIAPTSPNSSNIQDAVVNCAHRCTLFSILSKVQIN